MIESDAFYAALDEGLAALAAGTPLAQVTRDLTARYPAYAAELPELLAAAHAAGAGAPPAPPPARVQARSRAAFLGRAAALRPPPRRRGWAMLSLPLARAALTVLVFTAGFGAGTYGAVVASANALPGEALYGIKRTVENTELLLTGDSQTRSALEAEFTKRRVDEVQQLTTAGRTAAVEFTGWLSAMDGERWVVAGLPVLVPAGTPISGTPRPEVWVRVAGVVQPDRTVRAERVEVLTDAEVPLPTATPAASATPAPTATRTPAPTATRAATATRAVPGGEDVEFIGVVQSMGAGAWLIGGQAVGVNAATDLRDNPQVGDTVEVRAVRQADGSLLATRIRMEDDGGDDDGAATGAAPSSTPSADDGDDDGGGDDDNSGPSASNTPEPGDDSDDDDDGVSEGGDNSGSSATNTPEPGDDGTDDGGDSSGPSPSNTPEPDDDSDNSDDSDSDDNSGPSATNTPKPDEDDSDDD